MRVGFDALRALRNRTGLGTYSRRVLRALHRFAPATELYLLSSRPPRAEFAALPAELGARVIRPRRWGALAPALWRRYRAGHCAASYGIDVYHGLSHELPHDLPAGVGAVVTFHDLLFETAPELFPRIDRASYRWRYRDSARRADLIVAVSEATRTALVEHYQLAPERVVVIPPPVDPAFHAIIAPDAVAAMRERHRLPTRYMVSIGTLEPRKNHAVLLDALQQLGGDTVLALAGQDGGAMAALQDHARRLGIGARVRWLSYLAEADLPALVQGAALMVYPSRQEGFGMPIAESAAAGVPVIAGDTPTSREAGGEATVYAPVDDASAWAEAMRRLLGDPQLASALAAAGVCHAQRFDGATIAAALLDIYTRVTRRGGSISDA